MDLFRRSWKLVALCVMMCLFITGSIVGTYLAVKLTSEPESANLTRIVRHEKGADVKRACRGRLTVPRLLVASSMDAMGQSAALFMLSAVSGDMRRSCARLLAPGVDLQPLFLPGTRQQLAWVDDPTQCGPPISCITVVGEQPICKPGDRKCNMIWGIHTPRFGYVVYEVRMKLTSEGWRVGYAASSRSTGAGEGKALPGPFAS